MIDDVSIRRNHNVDTSCRLFIDRIAVIRVTRACSNDRKKVLKNMTINHGVFIWHQLFPSKVNKLGAIPFPSTD
jgi:hypothetical protein